MRWSYEKHAEMASRLEKLYNEAKEIEREIRSTYPVHELGVYKSTQMVSCVVMVCEGLQGILEEEHFEELDLGLYVPGRSGVNPRSRGEHVRLIWERDNI